MSQEQRILNWLENEKRKDSLQEKNYKKKIINEVKQLKKNEMFLPPKKLTLWQKIKIAILGI
jgi:hypothetical protein